MAILAFVALFLPYVNLGKEMANGERKALFATALRLMQISAGENTGAAGTFSWAYVFVFGGVEFYSNSLAQAQESLIYHVSSNI